MKLSVIILNFNVRPFLELCLASVEASIKNISAEIIVVDNASSDNSCEMVKSNFPKVHLIENSNNLGFSKGNNIGVNQAKGEYICILNPDTVVAEDTFESLLSFAEEQKKLGILGCRLIDGQGSFLPESKRHIPSPWVSTKKMLGFTNSYYVPEINENDIGEVEILVGAFMLLKKEVYLKAKGFDEDYFMYGEDVDLSYKISKLGYSNFYIGNSTLIHFKGESTFKDKEYIKRFYGAMQLFYRKHFKSNLIFNSLVWLWVKIAGIFLRPDKIRVKEIKNYIMISDIRHQKIEETLMRNLTYKSELNHYQNDTEYILDNNFLTFKDIIGIIDRKPKNSRATFKILLKNSNFLIGSDHSKHRGTVVSF